MLREGAELNWIRNRVGLPTAKSSSEIGRDIPPEIRARSFFSARVAEAHILDRFRAISDDYSTGKIGIGEARNLMRLYARESGRDDGTASLKNLASTARLNLILGQNAKMARAVGDYERMYSPANMEAFPYVIYRASVGSKTPRRSHQHYDGMIFDKKDPWLRSHWPPWEFGCNCRLENCSAKKAGKHPNRIQKVSPPEVAERVYSESGFKFDPQKAFDEFDMGCIRDQEQRRDVYRQMASMATRTNSETTFIAAPAKPVPAFAKPENLDEIEGVITAVKDAVDSRRKGEEYTFPEISCSLGYIAKERFDAIGMRPEDNVEAIFESPGGSNYGMVHWKRHHIKDWSRQDFVKEVLGMFEATIWNPLAEMANTHSKAGQRIRVTSPDGKYIANLWRREGKWVYSIQDAWDWSGSGSRKE